MTPVSAGQIRSFLLGQFSDVLSARGLSSEEVPDDFDLLTEGLIDSLGIIEMITAIEQEFDLAIDFEELDAEEMTIVGPLCRFIEQQVESRPEQAE